MNAAGGGSGQQREMRADSEEHVLIGVLETVEDALGVAREKGDKDGEGTGHVDAEEGANLANARAVLGELGDENLICSAKPLQPKINLFELRTRLEHSWNLGVKGDPKISYVQFMFEQIPKVVLNRTHVWKPCFGPKNLSTPGVFVCGEGAVGEISERNSSSTVHVGMLLFSVPRPVIPSLPSTSSHIHGKHADERLLSTATALTDGFARIRQQVTRVLIRAPDRDGGAVGGVCGFA
ncbi:hypothetical protein C8F04DRAFT_1190885 [Mycena alexandri]|uniref:Uncharacterized protein n=1 Tax=Mycena alexandri TaxID=1745969 RepID=A0AAD6WYX3_9AGAR|nr:hypothetical protein C8F04DRAFT_1190885 [Mycena alexandri]